MPTIGQKVEADTQLVCGRCGHMLIVRAGAYVRPCPACMHINFEVAAPTELPEPDEPAEIGLSYAALEEVVSAVLRARSGLNRMQVESIAEAVARAVEKNNRKLQRDIEAAFRELET